MNSTLRNLGILLIATVSATTCAAQSTARPTLSAPVPVDVPIEYIVAPAQETAPASGLSVGSRLREWFGRSKNTTQESPYVAPPVRVDAPASAIRPASLQSVEPPTATPRLPSFLPSSATPLPSMNERRESLRLEGLSSPTMKDFTAQSGTPPQAVPSRSSSTSEAGPLRRLVQPVRDRISGQPSPQGVMVLPEASPNVIR